MGSERPWTCTCSVPWGTGDDAIGWRAPATEFRGDGPSGIAIAPTGAVVVVDRLQKRLVVVDDGGLTPLLEVPEDTELLAFGGDGTTLLASPFRARAWIHARDGRLLGEVALPRLVGDASRLALGPSHQIEITTALQERFVVGGPSTPRDDAAVLRSKREGALPSSAAGPALVAMRTAEGALLLATVGEAERKSATRPWASLGEGDAVRLIGRSGGWVVAVTEDVEQPGEALEVTRELVVVDGKTGEVRHRRELPRGMWVPREWIAVSADAPAVAFMTPTPEGLRVERLDVALHLRSGHRGRPRRRLLPRRRHPRLHRRPQLQRLRQPGVADRALHDELDALRLPRRRGPAVLQPQRRRRGLHLRRRRFVLLHSLRWCRRLRRLRGRVLRRPRRRRNVLPHRRLLRRRSTRSWQLHRHRRRSGRLRRGALGHVHVGHQR